MKTKCKAPVKTLYLVRHGHGEEDSGLLHDFIRPLSRKGHRQTLELLHQFKAQKLPFPDCIFCSTATRAKQTAALLFDICPQQNIYYKETLYLSPDYRIFNLLTQLDELLGTVMIIAHHPGVSMALKKLIGNQKYMKELPFSSCAVLHLKPGFTWHTLKNASAHLETILTAHETNSKLSGTMLEKKMSLW